VAAGREYRAATQRCGGLTLIADKNYFGREFEQQLVELNIRLLRPARKGEAEGPGAQLFRPLRQIIESVNETFKGQLDLERHRGRTPDGCGISGSSESRRLLAPDEETVGGRRSAVGAMLRGGLLAVGIVAVQDARVAFRWRGGAPLRHDRAHGLNGDEHSDRLCECLPTGPVLE
jgi:hypothetical protein